MEVDVTHCRECGGLSAVSDTRIRSGVKWRRRTCKACDARWSTKEVLASTETGQPNAVAATLLAVAKRALDEALGIIAQPPADPDGIKSHSQLLDD